MTRVLRVVGVALSVLIVGVTWASAQPRSRNAILQSGSSPFEDLSELAVAGDWKGVDAAMKKVESLERATVNALAPMPRKQFESQLAAIRGSHKNRDGYSLALQAAETYRTLVVAQAAGSLTVPLEVSLLDYVGFKVTALLSRPTPDWQAVQATTIEGIQFWTALKGRVRDTSLQTLSTTTLDGLAGAAKAGDRTTAQFAAKVALDLVDVLENYFSTVAKGAAAAKIRGR